MENERKQFLDTSLRSNKWKKWIIPNSEVTDYGKSVISGHYIFSEAKIATIIIKKSQKTEIKAHLFFISAINSFKKDDEFSFDILSLEVDCNSLIVLS